MEDVKIVELYLSKSEEAIVETDLKYGKLCRYVAMNILRNNEIAKNVYMIHIWAHGTQSRRRNRISFQLLSAE